ncbi:MAG: phosphoribosylanthranilate isomerase [Robiginitomaculum sp.]|nr:phosphoribosylanthranilate isomerase [Robiginitomaculum sp.]
MKFKVCCIQSIAEAELAIDAGAWAIGLVANMPSGPGPIDDDIIRKIADATKDRVQRFLLTSRTQPDDIVKHINTCGTDIVQLVDEVPVETYGAIRKECPDVQIVQVIHVQDEIALHTAKTAEPLVDMILLDSGQPNAATKTLGGTGQTHNWELSRQIVQAACKPVWLAGGLSPANVGAAISRVQPFGVDLCSGIRDTNGALLSQQLAQFTAKL